MFQTLPRQVAVAPQSDASTHCTCWSQKLRALVRCCAKSSADALVTAPSRITLPKMERTVFICFFLGSPHRCGPVSNTLDCLANFWRRFPPVKPATYRLREVYPDAIDRQCDCRTIRVDRRR
ncbi:hypothetical protein XFF6166_210050 [Xanthomonas citri pv. fuscans]|nr:hypothetical protein XFF6166_210050 [Xanthomonas citri pv. fuscans]SON95157.1 hypothetical protein XFF6990_200159 [Xanthomonas citri pv. fuscans]SOO06283.1 hypothetical protein XFF7767_70015 [Xanthomonas citri pv. fuscans]SOO10371.1 hypothetical protein XFF6970_540052 [Xanthomonas citri pv. fuscans]SOO14974.1 hypothetical protein XFF7766_460027 [Xanthomonas citri pv. fuscans]